ncbi:RHS repeat-associated core domain-containing protein [Streptomyces sp. GC420]|uniref:RHS repeat domain-containing protein n=1 Tax=Streptomyces sp. GC420 TaxID=2697568 RepID=UPI0028BEECEA|nr:RHS repeat-associated core domain-containing protein [Streptomyces sp. GC420]
MANAVSFLRDPRGRELTRTFGAPDRPVTLATSWNEAGRPTAQVLATPDRTLRSRGYEYGADGYLRAVTDDVNGTSKVFDLDPVGRPLRVTAENWSETYAYDQAGNQTEAHWPDRAHRPEARGTRSYDGTRMLTAGTVRCEYDAGGRTVLRQKTRLSKKPDTWRYTWDAENRLTSCRTPDGVLWTYTYDPLGRRTGKHRMAEDGHTVVHSVHFTWDGTRLVEQTDVATGTTLTWDYEGRRPLTQWERRVSVRDGEQSEIDSRFFAIVTDLVGAPSELVSEQGEITWQTRTTVWGNTTWNRNAVAYTPLRFPGQYDDGETGFFYNCFRHYDPESARYASPDPLGLGAAHNPVAYVTNPQARMDPEGLIAKGCTESGGWYSGLMPANLKNDDGTRRTETDMEVNHIPAKASYAHLDEPGFRTNKRGGGAGMGPAIRMEYDDHRNVTSTGSSKESDDWRAEQRAHIDNGRWDLAMKMDIDEIRELYGDKYDTHIADMIESLKHNRKFQAMLEKRGWTIDYDILK